MLPSPNSANLESLQNGFAQCLQSLGADEATTKIWSNSLIKAYSEPQRHYHTTQHISSMLSLFQRHMHLITDRLVVQLAIYFHDWVYDPRASDNEIQSVVVFNSFASKINVLPQSTVDKVCHYIEATITHSLGVEDANDVDIKLFLDFDLEVLGRSKEEYELYARQIRDEYSHFSEQVYTKGRLGVITKFLARDKLYFSKALSAELEVQARQNLGAEIAGLKAIQQVESA